MQQALKTNRYRNEVTLWFSKVSLLAPFQGSFRICQRLLADDGATWTMVVPTPEGQSCVVPSGEAWAERAQSELGQAV